jgi:N-acetylmuramoyl-L-alanine amidase
MFKEIAATILLLFVLVGCSSHHHRPCPCPPPLIIEQKVPITVTKKGVIMIDPGHGGEDFGTHSTTPPRYQEKYLNLATSYMVQEFLHQLGYKTMMTRQKDVFVSLEQRAAMANREKPALFVSVHYNAAPSTQADGVEVYYYRSAENKERTAKSKKLAEMVLSKIIFKTEAKSRGVKHGDFAVIRQTEMPAILVEGGFLTNDGEMEKLKDPVYLKRVAWGIAEGIHQYLSTN